jgi:hypothetical protein
MSEVKYEVYVNDSDVISGLKQLRGKCAVAQALAREYPDLRYINVTREEIRFTDIVKRIRFTYQCPPEIAQFIDAWDRGKTSARPLLVLTNRMLKSTRAQNARSAHDLARPLLVNDKLKTKKPVKKTGISKRPLIDVA